MALKKNDLDLAYKKEVASGNTLIDEEIYLVSFDPQSVATGELGLGMYMSLGLGLILGVFVMSFYAVVRNTYVGRKIS